MTEVFFPVDDTYIMSRPAITKNLHLVENCALPSVVMRSLRTMIGTATGQVLQVTEESSRSVTMDFELVHEQAITFYALLVAAGVNLSSVAHEQLTSLCQKGWQHFYAEQGNSTRVSLILYAAACSGDPFYAKSGSFEVDRPPS